MNIFGIGGGEFFVIIILALIVFGPGKLPELMGDAGRMLRELRRTTRDLTADFEGPMKDIQDAYREVESDMRTTMRQIETDTKEISDEVNTTVSGATEFGKTTTKKRPAAASAKTADTSKPIDQQFEDETVEETVTASSTPTNGKAPAAKPAKPAKVKPKAVVVEEDLLAATGDDDDDLLADGDDVDDLLSATADDESNQSAAD